TELGLDDRRGGLDLVGVGDVARNHDRPGAERLDLAFRFLERLLVAREKAHRCAPPRERTDRRATDPRRRAGDDDHFLRRRLFLLVARCARSTLHARLDDAACRPIAHATRAAPSANAAGSGSRLSTMTGSSAKSKNTPGWTRTSSRSRSSSSHAS